MSQMDEIDCGILTGIYDSITYEELACNLNVSEGTIKYRLKKMILLAGVNSKQDLIDTIESNMGISAITSLYHVRKKST